MAVLERGGLARMPGIIAESRPVAVLPLGNANDAEGAVVALPERRYFRERALVRLWFALGVEGEVGREWYDQLALRTADRTAPQIAVLDLLRRIARLDLDN